MLKILTVFKTRKELRSENESLRRLNLKMRTELDVISENPEGGAARKIIEKYNRRRELGKTF